MMGLSSVPRLRRQQRTRARRWRDASRTFAGSIQRLHVEDVNALHLAQDLQPLQPGRLLEVGRHGADGGARSDEVLLVLDLCMHPSASRRAPETARVGRECESHPRTS